MFVFREMKYFIWCVMMAAATLILSLRLFDSIPGTPANYVEI